MPVDEKRGLGKHSSSAFCRFLGLIHHHLEPRSKAILSLIAVCFRAVSHHAWRLEE